MPTLFEMGDALRGDRVAINARRLSPNPPKDTDGRREESGRG